MGVDKKVCAHERFAMQANPLYDWSCGGSICALIIAGLLRFTREAACTNDKPRLCKVDSSLYEGLIDHFSW